jgi:hypothetical protein
MVFRTFFETIWSFAKRQFAKIVKEPTTKNRRSHPAWRDLAGQDG